ncbi:hypothetical protein F5146DRAFT_1002595 [Armillaria mellea]|nr:hypothetical protein F5146DRAFT_1002595 [Armillaria mellea]
MLTVHFEEGLTFVPLLYFAVAMGPVAHPVCGGKVHKISKPSPCPREILTGAEQMHSANNEGIAMDTPSYPVQYSLGAMTLNTIVDGIDIDSGNLYSCVGTMGYTYPIMPHSLRVQGRFHRAGVFGMPYLYAGWQGYDESYWSGVGRTTNLVSFNFSKVDVVAVVGSTSGAPGYQRMAELMPLANDALSSLIYVLAGYSTVEA